MCLFIFSFVISNLILGNNDEISSMNDMIFQDDNSLRELREWLNDFSMLNNNCTVIVNTDLNINLDTNLYTDLDTDLDTDLNKDVDTNINTNFNKYSSKNNKEEINNNLIEQFNNMLNDLSAKYDNQNQLAGDSFFGPSVSKIDFSEVKDFEDFEDLIYNVSTEENLKENFKSNQEILNSLFSSPMNPSSSKNSRFSASSFDIPTIHNLNSDRENSSLK